MGLPEGGDPGGARREGTAPGTVYRQPGQILRVMRPRWFDGSKQAQ